MNMYGKGRHTYIYYLVCANIYYSISVQWNHFKFAVHIAPYSGSLGLSLWHCSSFSFGIEKVLASRFDSPFKCTMAIKL